MEKFGVGEASKIEDFSIPELIVNQKFRFPFYFYTKFLNIYHFNFQTIHTLPFKLLIIAIVNNSDVK